MKIIHCRQLGQTENGINELCFKKNAVALGTFDGLHLGHAMLIREITKDEDTDSYVYTFDVHPSRIILNDPLSPRTITTNEQKVEILAKMGVGHVCFEDFVSVRDMSPSDFVKKVLIDTLKSDVVVCGFNFTFGKKGEGTSEFLKSELAKYGAECVIVAPVTSGCVSISSTRIRSLIEAGAGDKAAELLGRPFTIRRPVLHGEMLGRKLGIPTINQSFAEDSVVPVSGVYVCKVTVGGKEYPGVCDVGTKPTVSGKGLLAETHIIGYDGDLYGETVDVAFLKRLRAEKKFSDIDELKSVIENDVANAKKYFDIA